MHLCDFSISIYTYLFTYSLKIIFSKGGLGNRTTDKTKKVNAIVKVAIEIHETKNDFFKLT